MRKGAIKETLRHFGLTEKEAEVYIFLGKQGPMKGGDISKQLKIHKGQVYRTLKSLQKKGLVEATLEHPTHFITTSFERVIDSFIKSKREEVALIEKTKEELLSDWERISKTQLELPLEKFTVIEGSKKIFRRILDMVEKTKNSFSAILPISDLGRAEQFGVFDSAYAEPMKSKMKYRFLTELTEQNLKATKLLQTKLNAELNVKARNPDLGLTLFPRMATRDDKELLLFISPKKDTVPKKQEVCILTNCRSLVQAFSSVFEDLWRNSMDLEEKILEIETGKPSVNTIVIADAEIAKEKYIKTIRSAEEEIILMTSAKDLSQLSNNTLPLKELAQRKIKIKIMAPITTENIQSVKKLSKFCEVRHVASSYLGTTVIDGEHLFQLKTASSDREGSITGFSFKNAFYTTDSTYIEKTKNMLDDIWQGTFTPSMIKMDPTLSSHMTRHVITIAHRDQKKLPERLLSAGRTHHNLLNAIAGRVIISPPSYLKIPNIQICALNCLRDSPKENFDLLRVDLWLETPEGEAFVPVAIVMDACLPFSPELSKAKWKGTPAGQNVISVKPEELQVWSEGKQTLFAGWTVPIPLLPPKYTLDPACILFEAFGDEIHETHSNRLPSGFIEGIEVDGYEAFTTFISPSWKYSGPGIYGTVGKFILVNAAPETD